MSLRLIREVHGVLMAKRDVGVRTLPAAHAFQPVAQMRLVRFLADGSRLERAVPAAFRGDVTPGSLVRVGWLLVDASQRPYRVTEIETNLIVGKTYARVILTACRENVEIAE